MRRPSGQWRPCRLLWSGCRDGHSAAIGAALAALAADVGLLETVIWRGLRDRWAGRQDNVWPWSKRLRTGIEVTAFFAAAVAGGSPKAHDIQGGTWPAAVLFSTLCFGSLFAVCLIVIAVEHVANGPRDPD